MNKFLVISDNVARRKLSRSGLIDSRKNFCFFNENSIFEGSLLNKLCKLHFSYKLNKYVKLPFKFIWYKRILRKMGIKDIQNEKVYLFFYDRCRLTVDLCFFTYLKRKRPDIKTFYLFSNIESFSGANSYGITKLLNDTFAKVIAFDKSDALRYGFAHNNLIYELDKKYIIPKTEIKFDFFYCGKAKDRLEQLIEFYEKATKLGFRCNFNIMGVPLEKQKHNDKINYTRYLDYSDVVTLIQQSKCLIDFIQNNSTAMTIKFCEAVTFNKKIVTTNVYVKSEKIFNLNNVLIYNNRLTDEELVNFMALKTIDYGEESRNIFSFDNLISSCKIL